MACRARDRPGNEEARCHRARRAAAAAAHTDLDPERGCGRYRSARRAALQRAVARPRSATARARSAPHQAAEGSSPAASRAAASCRGTSPSGSPATGDAAAAADRGEARAGHGGETEAKTTARANAAGRQSAAAPGRAELGRVLHKFVGSALVSERDVEADMDACRPWARSRNRGIVRHVLVLEADVNVGSQLSKAHLTSANVHFHSLRAHTPDHKA